MPLILKVFYGIDRGFGGPPHDQSLICNLVI